MSSFLNQLWANDQGQDIAEYAVMLAVIPVLVVGTIRVFIAAARKRQQRLGTGP